MNKQIRGQHTSYTLFNQIEEETISSRNRYSCVCVRKTKEQIRQVFIQSGLWVFYNKFSKQALAVFFWMDHVSTIYLFFFEVQNDVCLFLEPERCF